MVNKVSFAQQHGISDHSLPEKIEDDRMSKSFSYASHYADDKRKPGTERDIPLKAGVMAVKRHQVSEMPTDD